MSRSLLAPAILAMGIVIFPYSLFAQSYAGQGSLGGSLGIPRFLTDSDMSQGQRPRGIGKFHFGYVFSEKLRLSLRGGFGWVGYNSVPAPFPLQGGSGSIDFTKVDQLTTLAPFTLALDYTIRSSEGWLFYGGLGPGLYRWNILNDRRTVHDPASFERFLAFAPGIEIEVGAEHFVPANRNVGLEFFTTYNYMFSADEERWPSGYNGNHSWFDLNFGVNVYFDLGGSDPEVIPVSTDDDDAASEPDAETPAEPTETPDEP